METGQSLAGRTAVVTGVGRQRGIGFAVARRLAESGANLAIAHWAAHDAEQPYGADSIAELEDRLRSYVRPGAGFVSISADFADPATPADVMERVRGALGPVDILVANHAKSGGDGPLDALNADMLEAHWRVNVQSVLLLTQGFAAQFGGEAGSVIWMTSGQLKGPMREEIAYASSKAALAGITESVADTLIDQGIRLNTVNPGPVNTGYLDEQYFADAPDQLAALKARFPLGRIGEPDDPARLIAWLVSDDARWVSGQVISSEGGFRRW
ncbi:SDR family oxidoreductase [Haematomicrobium sanguinis]|uniref:SDR family oxidoreductase n=1 Tax=Haematomicrobium sanguinis TaxID=479106 RepID=UPI00047982B2|nr:SDR family oxidoreductase [Haematomicrobium sanguinis]